MHDYPSVFGKPSLISEYNNYAGGEAGRRYKKVFKAIKQVSEINKCLIIKIRLKKF